MLTVHEVVEAIIQRAEGRYDVMPAEESVMLSYPKVECKAGAYRLKRSTMTGAGWRTVLLIELPLTSIQVAFHWSADVRDVLPEPETADLYMFLMINNISEDDAARIETDDRFCRKVVVRESEDVMDFLDRTFLAALDPAGDIETLSDPLVSALTELSTVHPWVSTHITSWKEHLLSTSSGAEVVQIFNSALNGSEEQL